MQFARISVQGALVRPLRVSRNRTSATTEIDDGSGTMLRVVFLEEACKALLAHDTPFARGTKLRVTGGVQIKADELPVMFIRDPDQFTQIPAGAP
jgi:hypothetical protein